MLEITIRYYSVLYFIKDSPQKEMAEMKAGEPLSQQQP